MGQDLYVLEPRSSPDPAAGPSTPDPRVPDRITADLAAGPDLDPLDMLDRHRVEQLWGSEGARLLAREDTVRAVAARSGWEFTELDARLSARLVEGGVTEGCPRVTRNVCVPPAPSRTIVTDLTGAIFDVDRMRSPVPRLRAATAGIVPFPCHERLAVVPAHSDPSSWTKFGTGRETESGEFDAAYRTFADDPRWTSIVLNPAMMVRLLERRPLSLVIASDIFAVISPGWIPAPALPGFLDFVETCARSARSASGS